MNGQRRVVRLHHGVRHLGGRDDRVRRHDAVGVLLADLGDEQGAHPRAGLPEHEVVGPEKLPEGTRPHGVHCARLEVHEDGARDVAAAGGLVEVAVDALQLEVGVAVVRPGGVDAVLIGDDFPELGPDLCVCVFVRACLCGYIQAGGLKNGGKDICCAGC